MSQSGFTIQSLFMEEFFILQSQGKEWSDFWYGLEVNRFLSCNRPLSFKEIFELSCLMTHSKDLEVKKERIPKSKTISLLSSEDINWNANQVLFYRFSPTISGSRWQEHAQNHINNTQFIGVDVIKFNN